MPKAKATAKRHMTKPRNDRIEGISSQGIRRMANRGGVKRMSGIVYEKTRQTMQKYLTNILRDTLEMTRYARRKTVFAGDVHRALRRNNRVLYGTLDQGVSRKKKQGTVA